MMRSIGMFDAPSVGMGLAAGLVLEIVYGGPSRRRRGVSARETSRAPAPLPGDLKRWAPPVLVEMTRQQRRAIERQVAADMVRRARAAGIEVREVEHG